MENDEDMHDDVTTRGGGSKIVLTCMKTVFLLFNLIFWVTGFALLVVGILTKFWFSYIMKLSTDIDYDATPYIMIGCGVFIVLLGFIGAWGALKEHSWALKMYMFVLAVLFLAEVVGALTAYLLKNRFKEGVRKGLERAVGNYSTDLDSRNALDQIQSKLGCCGCNSYTDYFNTTWNVNHTQAVPRSCCIVDDKTCGYKNLSGKAINETGIYVKGCYVTLRDDVEKNIVIIGGVVLGIIVFQLFGAGSAYMVSKKIQEPRYERV